MSVLPVSLRRREEGAMLFKQRLGFGWGQQAHVACWSLRGGRKPSTLLWVVVSSHKKLAARAVKEA